MVTVAYMAYSIAFDVQGTNILLEDNVVFNADDCLMLGPPANNIHFRNSYCNGGHGLSVGPFGKEGTVDIQNVLYVLDTLWWSVSLISLKDRGCCHGKQLYSWIEELPILWRRKIPSSEQGSRVGSALMVSPESIKNFQCILNGSDRVNTVSPGRTSQ